MSKATPLLAPAIVSAVPRARGASAQQRYDEMRRPQAALLFRALKAAQHKGMAWRECFALCEEPGAVVVWMRAHGVDVLAEYDVAGGETRFYLIEPSRPLAVGPIPDDGASGGPSQGSLSRGAAFHTHTPHSAKLWGVPVSVR